LLDWVAEGGLEGFCTCTRDKSHDITSREREKERVFRVFKNNKKNLQGIDGIWEPSNKTFDAILDVYKLPLISQSKTH
jgi:hypothetical protein